MFTKGFTFQNVSVLQLEQAITPKPGHEIKLRGILNKGNKK
tara:strand:+ start:248 stop:370 length:123 start_codon:yes stop_codon:yes gene_type:complete